MANTTPNEKVKAAMTAVSAKPKSKADLVCMSINAMAKQFAMALPMHLKNNEERYMRSFMTQIRQNPKLAECNMPSLLGAMMTGTALGLDPSPSLGEFYIIPYGREATFLLSYKGMQTLAYRAGVKKLWAHEVCTNDDFELEWGLADNIKHKPCLDPEKGRGKVIGYYAAAILPNGEAIFNFMTLDEIESHRARSMARNSGPWKTDYDEMAKKTCMRGLFKWLPRATEESNHIVGAALSKDNAVVKIDPNSTVDTEDVLEAEAIHEDAQEESADAEAPQADDLILKADE